MKNVFFILLVTSIPFIAISGNENIPVGARSAAMGNASVSLADGWSAHHNPAGLGFVRELSAGIYYENRFFLKALSIKGGTLALPVKSGSFGVCITHFGYPLYSENKYSLSFAKPFGNKLSAGIAMSCLSTKIAEGYGSRNVFVAELGLQTKPLNGLTMGFHLFNPTRAKLADYKDERIPTVIRLGAAYSFSDKVVVALETEKDISQKALYKAGIEYKAINELYFRAGISSLPALSAFGFGLNLPHFKIDLSANYHQTLGISPQLSLTYTLQKTKKPTAAD